MAAHEGIDYDPADGHYSDVVLTIRILMGKVQIYEFILSVIIKSIFIHINGTNVDAYRPMLVT